MEALRASILTPPPPATPRINGPRVFGARPGSVFLYTIPATGDRPMTFSADNLPAGLSLDSASGRITGRVAAAGEYKVTLRAANSLGKAARDFKIVIGDKLALTPPLGWSSWNAYGNDVSQEKILAVARAFASTGLVNHGWSYINIDDCWQGVRGGKHNAIQPNKKFPDMKKLADEIHALGLKFGIYSGPWVGTYAGYIGSYADNADGTHDWIKQKQHDEHYRFDIGNPVRDRRQHYKHGKYSFVKNDVAQWVEWGVDYLKYDWAPNDIAHTKEMLDALRATDRDIVYSISNSAPYGDAPKWAELTDVYRTTGDIRDTWKSVSALGFTQSKWAAFSGPGHWADPDMLVIGHVGGWTGGTLHYTKLTADEQYSHISLWALLSSPLLLGCDMAQIDEFTLSLLTNDEVLDINQDPLGLLAMPVLEKGDTVVYAKHLEDGSMAVGLFNKGAEKSEIEFTLKSLGLRGTQTIRDVWRQKDIATTKDKFSATVNPHGVLLLRISPGNNRK
ncbi:alpha-galactosidase [Ereboglobus luteus]|uniref:Alpha-galactosidase n=2 Tax=Ereboglobus luteus TaxID=1796921 RepID=A0A2U8E779_9BACT|nr:alpha-galactosidase [Ereboglobus luteus]